MIVKYEHLLGQEYHIGVRDCYSILRQFYADNFGLKLRNYARPQQWWETDMNLYQENFRKENFHPVDIPIHEVEIGDGLLMAFSSTNPNHAGVYVGDNKILHHFYNTLSRVDPLRTSMRNSVLTIVRNPEVHEKVVKWKEERYREVDVQELTFKRGEYVAPE